jgi:DNA invertase Pin-like site-specific DNA recombinase
MGRFLLTQMAAVVELVAGLIGERSKNALAAAKARGVKLGNPNGARASEESRSAMPKRSPKSRRRPHSA